MQAIGYVRVSTADQATEGVSLAAQGERIAAYCVAHEWELTAVYIDAGESAKSLDRAGLHAALEAVESGDVLIALKLDRLTRSVVDFYELAERCEAAGVRLAAVQESLDTGTASGRMVTSILASLSQFEREQISERTAAALAYKKAQGEHIGRVPFGFRVGTDGRLQENAGELATIQRLKRWRRRGASFREIARRLEAQGVESRGAKWSHTGVRSLVNDRLNQRKAKYAAA